MNKLQKIILVAILIVGGLAIGIILTENARDVGAQTLSTAAPLYCGGKTSTTTPNYLTTGTGTTTIPFTTDSFEGVTMLIRYFASSTNNGINTPTLKIARQASHNGLDWYDYNAEYTLTSMPPNASSSPFSLASSTFAGAIEYTPARENSTSTIAADAKLLAAKYTRFVISMATTSNMTSAYRDGGNLYCEIIGKTAL